jgi:TonB family protein
LSEKKQTANSMMKTTFLCLILSPWLLVTKKPAFSQEHAYSVQGHYSKGIKQKKLLSAHTLADFCEGFPTQWLTHYVSTEISCTSAGKEKKAFGKNDTLTTDQSRMIHSAEPGSDIEVKVQFMAENPVLHVFTMKAMHFKLKVIPEQEAEYVGGYPKMHSFLFKNLIEEITPADKKDLERTIVLFTVTEEGSISHIRLAETSGKPEVDRRILEALRSMPKWKPAVDMNGRNVEQEFELLVGGKGC